MVMTYRGNPRSYNPRHVIRRDEIIDNRYPALRVNLPNPFGHHFRFRQPDVITQRMDLTVRIGHADIVHINQRNRACPYAPAPLPP